MARKMFMFIGLLLAVALFAVNGCTTSSSSSNDPAAAPSGTTTIEVGSGGVASLTAGSDSGSASIIVIAQSANDPIGSPINSTSNLNINNITITITSAATSAQTATVDTVTFGGGASGDPISYALTLDRSGSMSLADIASMETAAVAFINASGASDQGAVINFDTNVNVDQGLTTNKTLLTQAATNPSASGGVTSLYDSIGTAITTAAAGSNTRKAAIAMSDGGENDSSTYTSTTAVIAHGVANGIPVYCVGLGLAAGSLGEQQLRAIASGTGGLYYYAPTYAELLDLYNRISSALSSSWTVSFTSPTTFTASTTYYVTITITYSGGITDSITFVVTL